MGCKEWVLQLFLRHGIDFVTWSLWILMVVDGSKGFVYVIEQTCYNSKTTGFLYGNIFLTRNIKMKRVK